MGRAQSELPKGGLRARYSESGSGHVIQRTHVPRGMVPLPANNSARTAHAAQYFFCKRRDALAHVGPDSLYMFPPIAIQLQPVLFNSPTLEEPHMVLHTVSAVRHSPMPILPMKGKVWHPNPELWALHVWPINGIREPL